jgi:hypothetical protein
MDAVAGEVLPVGPEHRARATGECLGEVLVQL